MTISLINDDSNKFYFSYLKNISPVGSAVYMWHIGVKCGFSIYISLKFPERPLETAV